MKRGWLALLLGLLIGVLPAGAQWSPWTAWLYNPNGTMTHISSDGLVLRQLALPTVPGQAYPSQVAVARGGQIVAYVTANRQLNAHRLVLLDLTSDAVLADYVATDLLETSLTLHADPLLFNETDSALAVGLAGSDGAWRLLALDVPSGRTLAELASGDAPATTLGIPAGAGMIPVPWLFQGGEVAFTMQQVGAPPSVEFGSYLWNVASGEVRENTLFPGLDNDILPATGELITPLRDPALPGNDALFGGLQQNTLQVIDPAAGRRFPFYNTAERALAAPRFIQNGERVLAATADGAGNVEWTLIERNGQQSGSARMNIATLFNLVDGFIYLTADDPATLLVVNTRDGLDEGVPVGQGEPGVRLQLAWAADAAVPPQVGYTPWIDLTDPVSIAGVTQTAQPDMGIMPTVAPLPQEEAPFFVAPTPAMLPTPSSFQSRLTVGGRAVVTEAGHAAGLHTGADSDAPALILLYTDMVVDVLAGPEITDGYIWWQVRTVGAQPRTGWAIEGARGQAYLVPVATD